ncbi:MAG: LexA family transcriptional regulator [Muribaculum sp.]|nr:LexA family transcriptional regulator [Muribaculum sp.]
MNVPENTPASVKERLLAYLKSKRITQTEFAHNLGVTSSYIGAMRKSISYEKLNKIESLYPDLNRDWLLFGTGNMLNSACDGANSGYEVPLLPVMAFAGSLQMWSEGVRPEQCTMVKSPVKDADYGIPICGDSMEPDFKDGSIVIVKKIDERAFIPWGSPMVIDTINGVLLKDIFPDKSDDAMIEAHSRNPRYPVLKIPKESILGLYRVLCNFKLYPTL